MKLTLALVLFIFALPSFAEAILFPAPSPEKARMTIASNTDTYAISPLIRRFQDVYTDTAIVYHEYQSNALFELAESACQDGEYFADLVISSSMAQQFKLANDGCAASLAENRTLAQLMSDLPTWAKWSDELVGLTFEPAAMVINREQFPTTPPKSHIELIDLLAKDSRFDGRIGQYDVALSGVGLLFAYADELSSASATKLQIYFDENNASAYCCTSQIIDLVADGRLDIGYNVLGSYALFRAERDPRLQVIFLEDFTPVLSRVAFIPTTAKARGMAETFLSFALSKQGQRVFQSGSRLMPSKGGAAMIEAYLDHPIGSLNPIALSPELLIILERARALEHQN